MAGTGEQPHVEREYFQDLSVRFSVGIQELQQIGKNVVAVASAISARSLRSSTGPLSVEKLDMKEKENAKTHHTDLYQQVQRSNPTPVLRRGRPFQCAVRFDRAPDIPRDKIRLVFDIGSRPNVSKGTKVVLEVSEGGSGGRASKSEWTIKLLKRQDSLLTFQVTIPVWAPVGAWRCIVQTVRGKERDEYRLENFVFILFNPWNPDDGVYMEDDDLRWEYVLNDTGKVWQGSANKPHGRPWVFGQFHDVALPACALLLERTKLPHSRRWDPVLFSRAVSAVINSNDDKGLVWGRWGSDYEGGTNPSSWTGTVAIMKKFLNNGHKPVRYGQCWVFSAATVTMCRALGIPCRSITNYESAHDTDGSMTHDTYYNKRGKRIKVPGSNDSVWNYHVWNEVWMRRPELGPEYDGWQAVDATPQERSNGLFQCGPASVKALRRGDVGKPYDAQYVYAGVNADRYFFTQDEISASGFRLTNVETSSIGLRQITKEAGLYDPRGIRDLEDVTGTYKPPEGSSEERIVNRRALGTIRGGRMRMMTDYERKAKAPEDICFELVEVKDALIGQSFTITMKFHNKSQEPRDVTCTLAATSIFYNGTEGHKIRHVKEEYTLDPDQCEYIEIQLKPEDYLDKLVDQCYINMVATGEVDKTGQTWVGDKTFELQTPEMIVQPTPGVDQDGDTISLDFSFQNPLNVTLTRCSAAVECPNVQDRKIIELPDIQPGELFSFTEQFQPTSSGEKMVVATFTSEKLFGVVGSCTFNVADS